MATARVSGLRRLGALLQRAREPVLLLDQHRKLVFVNQAWEELTGVPAELALGLLCPPTSEEGQPATSAELASLARTLALPPEAAEGREVSGPVPITRPDGERCWQRAVYTTYHDEAGKPLAWLVRFLPLETASASTESPSLRLSADLLRLREQLLNRYGADTLLGKGPAHQRLMEQVRTAAASSLPAIIVGEPGTGKQTAARVIHGLSSSRDKPLLPFDCAALPPEFIERDLLRHLESPTAASADLPEEATILLLNITELARDLQARLVPHLQGSRRMLATCSLDPELARRQERLRGDLYYALTSLTIPLEPLRDRIEELPLLTHDMLERQNNRGEPRRAGFEAEALAILAQYDWPGNLSELQRVVAAAHAASTTDTIQPRDLPAAIQGHRGGAYLPPPLPEGRSLDDTLTLIERRLIELALTRSRHNKSRAADLLKISRPRLYRRIKELDLPDVPEPAETSESSVEPTPL